MAISVYWTFFAICLIERETTHGSNDFMDTVLFGKMKEDLNRFCPRVDICNRNASEPTILPNIMIDGSTSSCCGGCSCHEDCYENMNCCFQDDSDDAVGVEKYSSMECLSVIVGGPNETGPAYRIVTSAPRGGCISYMPSESPVNQGLTPSCGPEPVAPWGNLLPVYSQDHDKIFKNAECALCHNVTNVIPWLSVFVCNDDITISQMFQVLEVNIRMPECFMIFRSTDSFNLESKRCYPQPVSTCKTNTDTTSTREYTQLSPIEIKEACESGLESTISFENIAYRNMYCLFCNAQENLNYLKSRCTPGVESKFLSSKLSVLLDAENFQMINQDGRSDKKIAFPQACVNSGHSQASEVCRDILCPSGQKRRSPTDCMFLSKRLFVDSVIVTLRLSYPDSQDNILTLFKQGIVKGSDVAEGLQEQTPWPNLWILKSVFHTNENNSQKSLMIYMTSEIKTHAKMFHSFKTSIAKAWTVTLNGSSFMFKQSFCEFSFSLSSHDGRYMYIPEWIISANSTTLQQMNVSNIESHTLNLIYRASFSSRPRPITKKMFVCEQITLYSGEFNLLANTLVLISNLTIRALYDREFELVYEANNTVNVRVCASDTVFKVKNDKNGSQEAPLIRSAISMILAVFVWIFV